MTQEKDQKAEGRAGPGRIPQKTLVGVARMPSNRPPRPSDRASKPPGTPSRPPTAHSPARSPTHAHTLAPTLALTRAPTSAPAPRDFFAALSPGKDSPKPTQGHREKQASLEEISNSMLLDDDTSSVVMPGLEELSGSLLLEDLTEVRADLAAAPAPQPATPEREPPAAHRALLGMPELPTSTPASNLAAMPPMPSSSGRGLHRSARPVAQAVVREGAHRRPHHDAHRSPRHDADASEPEGPEGDDPTRIMPPASDADDSAGIVPPPPQQMYEALKGYEAHAAGPEVPPDAKAGVGRTAQSAPVLAHAEAQPTFPMQGDVEVTSLPVSRWVVAAETAKGLLQKFRASLGEPTRSRDAKRPWFLGAIALAGLVVGIGLVALIVSFTRKGTDAANEASEKKASGEGSSAASAPSATAQAAPTVSAIAPAPAPEPAPQEPAASTTACKVAGTARVVAPAAIVSAGIEVRAVGDDVALGFAPNEHQATALRLDAASLAGTFKVEAQSADAIRRVVPLASTDGALGLAEDADRDGDSLQGRRTVPLDPPVEIGGAAGNLVWARPNGPVAGKLWPLDGDGSVEAPRGAIDPGPGEPITAIALRHAGAIWLGAASGRDSLNPLGQLTRAAGSSAGVGSPAVAASGGVVIAAWADRAAATDPWRLRWVSFKAGEAPGEPGTFLPPAGGRGEQAMSPGIASVPGGRFLLVWTEGPATRHDVRALTLSREGQPLGKPLVISGKKVNAGQGQGAVTASGRGAVAFLESTEGGGFQVVATPIKCAP